MKIYQVITILRHFEDSSVSVWTNEFKIEADALNFIHEEVQKKEYYSNVTINEFSASAYDEGLNQEYNWEVNELNIDIDEVKEFCTNEAKYRLEERFEIPKEQISEEVISDAIQAIHDVFTYYDPFYEAIDYNINEVLEKHGLR